MARGDVEAVTGTGHPLSTVFLWLLVFCAVYEIVSWMRGRWGGL